MPIGPVTAEAVAIIPARGGSKRIPRKNVRSFRGRPLIAWTIESVFTSAQFATVVVSTDDDEIADVARNAGADVPFVRPAELSDDYTPTVSVIQHALRQIDGAARFALSCCVYPGAVLSRPEDFQLSGALMRTSSKADFVVPVVRFAHPIQRAIQVDLDGFTSYLDPSQASLRTQDLEPRWHDAGQFYWGRTSAWLDGLPVVANAIAFEMDADRVLDIDDVHDWRRAEALHRIYHDV